MHEHITQLSHAFARDDWGAAHRAAVNVLRALTISPSALIARAHPLGFIHLSLLTRPDGSVIRMHLWPKEPFELQQPAWVVHRHAWVLRSLVVSGAIRDGRYCVRDEPDGEKRLYEAGYSGRTSVLLRTPRAANCTFEGASLWRSGEHYDVPSDAFHTSAAEAPTVTIAESGTPLDRPPLVVGESGASDVVRYRRRELDSTELGGVLAEVWP